MTHNKRYYYSRCLSDNDVNNFKEAITSHLPSVEYGKIIEDAYLNLTPGDIDYPVDTTFRFTCCRVSKYQSSASRYNSHIRKLKPKTSKMETK